MRRPLRIAALVAITAGLVAILWLALGAPGSVGSDDAYYRLAHARNLLPFAGATTMVAVLVFVAGGTGRSRGRSASIALWLLLFGTLLVLAETVLQIAVALPRRVVDFGSAAMWREQGLMLLLMAGGLSLLAGGVLWLLSYRLDRARSG